MFTCKSASVSIFYLSVSVSHNICIQHVYLSVYLRCCIAMNQYCVTCVRKWGITSIRKYVSSIKQAIPVKPSGQTVLIEAIPIYK